MIIVHFLIFLLFLQKYFVECEKCSTFARWIVREGIKVQFESIIY